MAVHLQLDKKNLVYTNCDVISGKAILSIQRQEAFSAITVKLECESRTKLAAPSQGRRDYDVELECHKLLYQTLRVFPTPGLQQMSGQSVSFVLDPGQHEFPFHFKIPFNNACAPINSLMAVGQDFLQHIKRPLPPSLSGFPGEAEIRYYLKVTAQRPAFYRENFRTEINFKFFPLEPPRAPAPANRRESYARRQHQFAPPPGTKQKSGAFGIGSPPSSGLPPTISIDGRLPDPAIITCNEPIPLRVLIKKLNETSEIIYIHTFQIVLIGYTKIKAHGLERTEKSSWVIFSAANMQTPMGNSNTPANKDMEVDSSMWSSKPLPNTVCPSFETCNVSRYYELEISVGLVHGTPGNMKPELTIQPLRMPVTIFSGIKPSEALINANNAKRRAAASSSQVAGPDRKGSASLQPPPRPAVLSPGTTGPPSPGSGLLNPPPQLGDLAADPELPDVPPPSYEDAIAEDLAPMDGPRADYRQPSPAGVGPSVVDEKRSLNT